MQDGKDAQTAENTPPDATAEKLEEEFASDVTQYDRNPVKNDPLFASQVYEIATRNLKDKGFTQDPEVLAEGSDKPVLPYRIFSKDGKKIAIFYPCTDNEDLQEIPYRLALEKINPELLTLGLSAIYIPILSNHFKKTHFRLISLEIHNGKVDKAILVDSKSKWPGWGSFFAFYPALYFRYETMRQLGVNLSSIYTGLQPRNDRDSCGYHVCSEIASFALGTGVAGIDSTQEKFNKYVNYEGIITNGLDKIGLDYDATQRKPVSLLQSFLSLLWQNKGKVALSVGFIIVAFAVGGLIGASVAGGIIAIINEARTDKPSVQVINQSHRPTHPPAPPPDNATSTTNLESLGESFEQEVVATPPHQLPPTVTN